MGGLCFRKAQARTLLSEFIRRESTVTRDCGTIMRHGCEGPGHLGKRDGAWLQLAGSWVAHALARHQDKLVWDGGGVLRNPCHPLRNLLLERKVLGAAHPFPIIDADDYPIYVEQLAASLVNHVLQMPNGVGNGLQAASRGAVRRRVMNRRINHWSVSPVRSGHGRAAG